MLGKLSSTALHQVSYLATQSQSSQPSTTSFTGVVGSNQTLVNTTSISRLLQLTDKQLSISSMEGLLQQATESKLILELEQLLLSMRLPPDATSCSLVF
jgi:hypothetical protein